MTLGKPIETQQRDDFVDARIIQLSLWNDYSYYVIMHTFINTLVYSWNGRTFLICGKVDAHSFLVWFLCQRRTVVTLEHY